MGFPALQGRQSMDKEGERARDAVTKIIRDLMEIPDKTQGLINGQPKTSHVTVSNQQQLLWVYGHRSCQANLVYFSVRSPTQPLKERA